MYTPLSSYKSTLADFLDSVDDFQEVEFYEGDIVRFEPYYASDEGGVGIIKKITVAEFKNKDYDATDENSPLFVSLPCAIVVSALPNETWLDYVPLHYMEILTLSELIQEIADALPEYDAFDLWLVRREIARKLSQYRNTEWDNQGSLPLLPAPANLVSFQPSFGGGVA